MGTRSFAHGMLTAIAAAAATDTHTHPTYERVTYTPVTHTPVYEQATPTRVVYTTGATPTLTEKARYAFNKMMQVNKAFTISNSDCLYEVGKELRRIYLEDETIRTSMSFDDRKTVRKVMDVYDLPIGDAKMLAFRFGRLVKSNLV